VIGMEMKPAQQRLPVTGWVRAIVMGKSSPSQ